MNRAHDFHFRRAVHPAHPAPASAAAPPIVHSALRSTGAQLHDDIRRDLEPRFGYDFSQVRVHTDAQAAESARAVGALAYTVGNNVVFAAGQYAPRTAAGLHLLAHELAHVTQQASGGAPSGSLQPQLQIGSPGGPLEDQADAAARAVIHGSAPGGLSRVGQPLIQRTVSPQQEIDWERANPAGGVEEIIEGGLTAIVLWNFTVGSADLKPEHAQKLDRIAEVFADMPAQVMLDIEGHTSSTGGEGRNQGISQRRARQVKHYLGTSGVFGPQMITSGRGETSPWVPNTTPENMARNRRVVIRSAQVV